MDADNRGERSSLGVQIYPNCAAITYGYDGSGNLITETLVQDGVTYIKTYTWAAGKLTNESLWVKQ